MTEPEPDRKGAPAGRRASRGLDLFDQAFLSPAPAEPAPAPAEPSFRERALSSGENPLEHIDRLVRPTSSRMWLGVLAFAALVGAAVVWTALAQRTVTVASQAVLIPRAGLFTAGELAQGAVTEVAVAEGDTVTAGQRLAVVATPDGELVVTSPVDGEVVSVANRVGELHAAGDPIVVVAPSGDDLVAIALLPPGALSAIAEGQPTTIAVNGVAADRYGRIRGEVASIGTVPASRARLRQLTGDAAVTASMTQQGPVYEVVVTLEAADTPSGLRWTQGDGPAAAIPIGALGVASVTVDHQSLISKAFG